MITFYNPETERKKESTKRVILPNIYDIINVFQ